MIEDSIFKQKISEGINLSKELSNSGMALSKAYPKPDKKDELGLTRSAVARGYLIAASQLSWQITEAVVKKHIGLAIIGSKTMIEYRITACFIFDHPKYKAKRVDKFCKEVFKSTNDMESPKNKIGDYTVEDRMKSIDQHELYTKNYAALNDYSHLVLRQNLLHQQHIIEKFSVDIISQSMCYLVGVIDSINNCFELGWDKSLYDRVIQYRDKYESKE